MITINLAGNHRSHSKLYLSDYIFLKISAFLPSKKAAFQTRKQYLPSMIKINHGYYSIYNCASHIYKIRNAKRRGGGGGGGRRGDINFSPLWPCVLSLQLQKRKSVEQIRLQRLLNKPKFYKCWWWWWERSRECEGPWPYNTSGCPEAPTSALPTPWSRNTSSPFLPPSLLSSDRKSNPHFRSDSNLRSQNLTQPASYTTLVTENNQVLQ